MTLRLSDIGKYALLGIESRKPTSTYNTVDESSKFFPVTSYQSGERVAVAVT